MKKYIITVITFLSAGSILTAIPSYAHGMGRQFPKGFALQNHQTHLDSRLQALVDQGKITADQKKLIEDKFKSLFEQKQQLKTDWKNKTWEERKTAREKEMADLEAWAKDNGIDLKLIFGQMNHKMMKNK
jgi:hypothetical protein